MQVIKERLNDYKYLLHVEATAEDVSRAYAEGLNEYFARTGTRPLEAGETIESALRDRFGDRGEQARAEVIINYMLPYALEEANLIPAVSPVPDAYSAPEAGKPYSFSVEVYVRPEFELSSYEPVTVELERPRFGRTEVNNQILALSQEYAYIERDELSGLDHPVAPEVNDTWVKKTFGDQGITSVNQLRAYVEDAMHAAIDEQMEQERVSAAIIRFAGRINGVIPQEIVDVMAADMMAQVEEDYLSRGTLLEAELKKQNIARADFEADVMSQAYQTLAEGVVMDAIFCHEGLQVGDQDIQDTIVAIASTAEQEDQEATLESLKAMGKAPAIVEMAKRMVAGRWIADHSSANIR